MFNTFNVSKEQNIPQKHRIGKCFNCGDPNHGVPKCPTPIVHKRIDQALFELSQGGGIHGAVTANLAVVQVMNAVKVI